MEKTTSNDAGQRDDYQTITEALRVLRGHIEVIDTAMVSISDKEKRNE
jgi:hypothetical protein